MSQTVELLEVARDHAVVAALIQVFDGRYQIASLDRREQVGAVRLQRQHVVDFELPVLIEVPGFRRMLKPDRE